MDKNKIIIILITVLIYAISTSLSYAVFSKNIFSNTNVINSPLPEPSKDISGRVAFNGDLPKTEQCPLNGVLYPKPQRQWWEKHRPLGVMIENHQESRPQSGLSYADVVYEIVAEGGITRFLAIYYCQDAGQIGPIRSARTYFLDFISEYGSVPLYTHVGGANTPGPADALSQIENYGWAGKNDLNQFSIGFPTFWRDYDRLGRETATEHTMYSTTTKLWEFAKDKRKLTNLDGDEKLWDETFLSYSFKDEATLSKRPDNQIINIIFWGGYKQYEVEWSYDKSTNAYKRKNGGVSHIDKNTDKQLDAKNIAVLFMRESNANDGYENNAHLLYKTKGSGKAQFFIGGEKLMGTWKKDSRTDRTLFFDNNGNPIKLNRGTIWFEILPLDGEVLVK